MNTAVIYARVSSTGDRQTTERQVADLKKYISINEMELVSVFEEKMSGAKENRPVLTECIEYCITNKVHTLCVSEISRLGHSTKIFVNTLDELTKAGVNVYIQNLPLCSLKEDGQPNPIAKMITAVLSSFAEIERDNIKYRLNSGRELAKAKGVKMGRKVGSVKSKEQKTDEFRTSSNTLKRGNLYAIQRSYAAFQSVPFRELRKSSDCNPKKDMCQTYLYAWVINRSYWNIY